MTQKRKDINYILLIFSCINIYLEKYFIENEIYKRLGFALDKDVDRSIVHVLSFAIILFIVIYTSSISIDKCVYCMNLSDTTAKAVCIGGGCYTSQVVVLC